MDKYDIIEEWARNKRVENIIYTLKISGENPQDIEELIQDTYMALLETDDDRIKTLYEKNQIDFYLLRFLKNNLYSKTSRYYYKYKKNNAKTLMDVDEDYKEVY